MTFVRTSRIAVLSGPLFFSIEWSNLKLLTDRDRVKCSKCFKPYHVAVSDLTAKILKKRIFSWLCTTFQSFSVNYIFLDTDYVSKINYILSAVGK